MAATCFDTPIGSCSIAWNKDEITGFSLPPATNSKDPPTPWVDAIIARVGRHLAGEMQDFSDLPYAWSRVSLFQRAVYEAALQVKPGQTWSYGQLAAAIGQPTIAARAVGTALGQNPWPLLVPCHRFIGADGRMTGFSAPGGIKTKLRLLALEGAELFAE
jgi:methylated-DNA-[protein]-cysteine S-methyltransferase